MPLTPITGEMQQQPLNDNFSYLNTRINSINLAVYNVKDIAYGAIGDGITPDTASILSAISAAFTAGGGTVFFPYGDYKITATLTVDKSIYIESDGATLSWYGGALPILTCGGNAVTTLYRLFLKGLIVDGRGLATIGVNIVDLQDGMFENLLIKSCVTTGIYFTNTAGLVYPSGFCKFKDIKIQQREGSTPSGHGIVIDGKGTGAEGTTISIFDNIRIEHANGDGVMFVDYGDGMEFNKLFTWRANTETGIGVHYTSTLTTSPYPNNSGTIFINPILTAGMKIDNPSPVGNYGITVLNIDCTNVNTGITVPIYGPGAADVNGFDTLGRKYGIGKVNSGREISTSDRFKFMNFDSAGQFLYTNDGVWKTSVTAGGSIFDPGNVGGGCQVYTNAALNDISAFYDTTALGSSGVTVTNKPIMMIETAAIDLADTKYRFGFMDAITDPPTNGIYIEGTAPGNWKIVCRAAGVEASVDTGVAIAIEARTWLIYARSDHAVFYTKLNTSTHYTYFDAITTNIPTVALDTVFLVKALAADNKDLRVLNYMISHDLE